MDILPLAEIAVQVHPADNVAVVKDDLLAGSMLLHGSQTLVLVEDVPAGHRFALLDLAEGEVLRQYNQPFALSGGLRAGQRVSEGNVRPLPVNFNGRLPRSPHPLPAWENELPTFRGYLRPDGSAGVRNWVAVIPTSMCASHEARLIAETAELTLGFSAGRWPNLDGVTHTGHTFGCGCMELSDRPGPLGSALATLKMLAAAARHPNVGAVLLVELGCEKTNLAALARMLSGNPDQFEELLGKPADAVSIQTAGGTRAAVTAGLGKLERLLSAANKTERSSLPVSKLALGLKCGGSDAFSGITANPALGVASDLLIQAGGRSVISEIPEFFGAEAQFASRAINNEVEEKIWAAMERYRRYLSAAGADFEDNPSPGNRAGGLLNIAIKSLGAAAKSGQGPVNGVLEYGESVWKQPGGGLYLLYGPGYDQLSTPALAAAGCQMVCFTTGRGTGIGNALAPVIKIASTSTLAQHQAGDIDLDAGQVLSGKSMQAVGEQIFQHLLRVASGEQVKAEENLHREFAIWSEETVSL